MRTILKKYYFRQIVACWVICSMLLAFAPVRIAMAATPVCTNDGGATVLQNANTTVTVNQAETIMKWSNFDTAPGESVTFEQGILINSAVLNRISGAQTQYDGILNGEGMRIFLLNPAGIIFGETATINVSQLVASSLNIADGDFLNGLPYTFTGGTEAGIVEFRGSTTNMVDVIALIGREVINKGALVAKDLAIMAAGDTVLISENSPVVVKVEMGGQAPDFFKVINHKDGDGITVDESLDVDGDGTAQVVLAAGDVWSAALVKAYSDGGSNAVATVYIDAAGDVTVTNKLIAEAAGNGKNNTTAAVTVNSGGDVKVIADSGETSIQAKAMDGGTNTSEILICADGYLTVEAQAWKDLWDRWHGGIASIEAIAQSEEGVAQNNTADVKIGAKEGINVSASGRLNIVSSEASIAAKATGGVENTASVVACTEGDLQVIDVGGGEIPRTAKIVAEAKGGKFNTADVGICADFDADGAGAVVVAAIEDGTAKIKAQAEAGCQFVEDPDSTADAEVTVVSKKGNVKVTGESGGSARIEADARHGWTTEASVGVSGENVAVIAGGYGVGLLSDAGIHALARWGSENTADTVVCAPGTVAVISNGGNAEIEARAEMSGLNTATTQVYASDIIVSQDAFIRASAYPKSIHVTDWSLGDPVPPSEGGATLIIDDYSLRKDCPECPECPCQEEEELFAPVAPLPPLYIPRIEGCPELTQAAAAELGIPSETLQVAIGNALALNPSIQPCEACAKLVNAASILRDEDGSRMAAMAQVFNTLAPADAPFTPEMATSIAMAFEGAAEGSQYASVAEYIDAFTQYVAVLDIDLGSPVGDSVAFVMEKYGAGITGSDNGNIAAFVATRTESGETF